MRIEIKLYASLARYMPGQNAGITSQAIEVEEGTTVGKLLGSLEVPANAVKLIFLNGIHAQVDQLLRDGDKLGVFPAVAGG